MYVIGRCGVSISVSVADIYSPPGPYPSAALTDAYPLLWGLGAVATPSPPPYINKCLLHPSLDLHIWP